MENAYFLYSRIVNYRYPYTLRATVFLWSCSPDLMPAFTSLLHLMVHTFLYSWCSMCNPSPYLNYTYILTNHSDTTDSDAPVKDCIGWDGPSLVLKYASHWTTYSSVWFVDFFYHQANTYFQFTMASNNLHLLTQIISEDSLRYAKESPVNVNT